MGKIGWILVTIGGICLCTQFLPKNLLVFLMFIYTGVYIFVLLKTKIITPIVELKRDNIEKINYYRDELDEYSPMINAKLLGKDIFDPDVITAMILYLKNKGWDAENEILGENNMFQTHEKTFIEKSKMIFSYLNNKKQMKNELILLKNAIEESITKDLKKEGLLKKDYVRGDQMERDDLWTLLFIMINIPFLGSIFQSNNKNIIGLTEHIQIIANSIWITVYLINIKLNLCFTLHLDNKGKDYAQKLRASKRYLKQYTLINDKNIESEVVWGAYIRNAIFFNLKGLLDKNSKDYYINEISKYGYIETKKQNWILSIVTFVLLYGVWIFAFIIADFSFKLLLANFLIYPFIFIYFIGGHFSLKV